MDLRWILVRGQRQRRSLLVLSVVLVFAACSGSGDGEAAEERAETSLQSEPTTTTSTSPAASVELPACEIDPELSVVESLGATCQASCSAAFTFAGFGTNPGLDDVFGFDAAYVRLTDLEGTEISEGEDVALIETSVEMLGIYTDRSDPNVPRTSAGYLRWGPTGAPASDAETVYDAYSLIGEGPNDIEITFEGDGGVADHPLRETAQYLSTPVGCLANPHRSTDAETLGSPPVTTTTTTTAPPTTAAPSTTTDRTAEASRLFVDLVNGFCDPAQVPEGSSASLRPVDADTFLVTDADGAQLLLEVDRRIVTSTDGEGGVLPPNYSFGCDPAVFVGTLPN